jgi:hypothetical protein
VPNVSFYTKITSTIPALRVGLSFDQLLGSIGPHVPIVRKDDAPMFSACEYHHGHGPSREEGTRFVVCGHFGVADLDGPNHTGIEEAALGRICVRLRDAGIPFRVASTYSHPGGDRYAVRVIFPFSRQVLVSEWKLLWERIDATYFENTCDKSCKDITRRYFIPSVREGSGIEPVDFVMPGDGAVDVDALLGAHAARGALIADEDDPDAPAPAALVLPGGGIRVSRVHLRRVRDALAASRSAKKKQLGTLMSRLIHGEELLADGDGRHTAIFQLVAEILDRFPLADPESLVEHFAPSIALMPGKSLDEVRDAITHRQAAPRATLGARMREVRRSTTDVAEHIGANGYTPEGIEAMHRTLGTTQDDLNHQWVIQRGDSFYVLCNGVYRCYSGNEIESAVLRDLAPAVACGVDLNEATANGVRPKKTKELMRDYGQVAGTVIVDMSEQRTHFDQERLAMIEAPCPIVVDAKYHPEVDRWLHLLAGPERIEKLRQWLACVPRLREPCAALFLEGERGTGKTFLAKGLALMFGREPTALQQAFDNFNEALMHCPVVLADEKVPTDLRGRVQTDTMREFIQARARPLKRKFKPDATLHGAVRLIIAANNRNLLATSEHLTEHDIAAIVERFLHIPAGAEARPYLLDQPTKKWDDERWIAEHAMWLAENLEVPTGQRFLVTGDATTLTNELATGTGVRSGICEWLVNYLLHPGKLASDMSKDLVRVREGRLLVFARAMSSHWDLYVNTKRDPPTTMAIGKAIGGLSKEVTVRDKFDPTKTAKMRDVDIDKLVAWANEAHHSEEKDILAALRRLDEVEAAQVN